MYLSAVFLSLVVTHSFIAARSAPIFQLLPFFFYFGIQGHCDVMKRHHDADSHPPLLQLYLLHFHYTPLEAPIFKILFSVFFLFHSIAFPPSLPPCPPAFTPTSSTSLRRTEPLVTPVGKPLWVSQLKIQRVKALISYRSTTEETAEAALCVWYVHNGMQAEPCASHRLVSDSQNVPVCLEPLKSHLGIG